MKSRFFKAHELVPPRIFKKYGEGSFRFVDKGLITDLDSLKEYFSLGTMTINNYYWGGNRIDSGLRLSDSKHYSETSMHPHGKAVDIIFSDYSAQEVRIFIIENQHLFKHIKGIEMGVIWLHIDTRNEDGLQLFYPSKKPKKIKKKLM